MSSGLLLELIRARRDRNLATVGLSVTDSILDDGLNHSEGVITVEEKELRRVALSLISLFIEDGGHIPSTSTASIAKKFEGILERGKKKEKRLPVVKDCSVTGRDLRTLLRTLANPPSRRGNAPEEVGQSLWTLKPQFVTIARQFAVMHRPL